MTREEAIKRYTSNAFYEKSDGNLQGYLEFNQLAEWLKDYNRLLEQSTSYEQTINKLTKAISEQEPKKGHWEAVPFKHGEYRPRKYACSECGWEIDLCRGLQQDTGHRLFCEHCGADMRTEAIAEEKKATPDLLVLRSPFFMTKEDADKIYEHFLKQKNKGMVILPTGWDCLLVPESLEIKKEQNPWEIVTDTMEKLKDKTA